MAKIGDIDPCLCTRSRSRSPDRDGRAFRIRRTARMSCRYPPLNQPISNGQADTLASTLGAPSQNNDGWGQSSSRYAGRGRGVFKRTSCPFPPVNISQPIGGGGNSPRSRPVPNSSASQTIALHPQVALQGSTEQEVPGAAGSTMGTSERGNVMDGGFLVEHQLQMSSQNHGDARGKARTSPAPPVHNAGPSQDSQLMNQNVVTTNADAVMEPILCTDTKVGTSQGARGTEAETESSAFSQVGPTPVAPKVGRPQPNLNSTVANGATAGAKAKEVDIVNFKLAVAGFAKPKLRPFWLKQHLTNGTYQKILDKFVENVVRSLGYRAPQSHEDSRKFIKEQKDSLSKFLQMYLRRFVSEDVIKNMRDEEKLDKQMVFP